MRSPWAPPGFGLSKSEQLSQAFERKKALRSAKKSHQVSLKVAANGSAARIVTGATHVVASD